MGKWTTIAEAAIELLSKKSGGALPDTTLPIRPARENLRTVVDSNTIGGRVSGDEMLPIDSLSGGPSLSARGQKAVDDIVDQMSGPDGFIERLIVDQDNNVIEGAHRVEALRRLGIEQVPITRVVDPTASLDLPKMGEAINAVGPIHSDHVNQITAQVGDMLAEVGGDPAKVLQEFDLPKGFERFFRAALDSVSPKTLPTDEASRTLLDKVRKEGGGSEGISAIFEETGDPLNSIADIYNLDTVRPSDVANVRGELGRITRESLSVLPDTITVYRGGNIRGELVPVTTSRDTARHFAKQSGEPLLEFQIPKSAVVADVKGILGSNASFLEGELLVRPSALRLPTDEASRMARSRSQPLELHDSLAGPQLINEEIALAGARPPGGGGLRPRGTEGTEQIEFSIFDQGLDGWREVGVATVNVSTADNALTNNIEGLVNIEISPKFRGQGIGQRVVGGLQASSRDGLKLYDIKDDARSFWEQVGATNFKKRPDGSLDADLPTGGVSALPMDEASRMARAQEMGFDVDTPLYHLTKNDFDEFKLGADPSSHAGGGAIWLRDDPSYSLSAHQTGRGSGFDAEGVREIPVYIRGNKELTALEWSKMRASGLLSRDFPQRISLAENKLLRDMGYSHVVDRSEVAVFDPSNVRSRFAQFDPAKAGSPDILAGLGVVGAGAALSQQDGFDYGALSNVVEESNVQSSN